MGVSYLFHRWGNAREPRALIAYHRLKEPLGPHSTDAQRAFIDEH